MSLRRKLKRKGGLNLTKRSRVLEHPLPPAARAIYKYSLGLSDEDQKKPHLVIDALRKFYGAGIGISGERQKFLLLLQEQNEPIASWETRVRNQGAHCEYEYFADELMRDQFIAGLTSEAPRVKLIGKGHRHRDSQTKVALREVVEAAKSFEATTYANQLMKSARGNQEQVNFTGNENVEKDDVKRSGAPCYWCSGNHKEPRQQHCPTFRKRCNNCGIIGHFSRACRSRGGRGGRPQRREANLVESEQDEEAFASEAISASSTCKKTATKFFAHLHLVTRERRKLSGHKLILPPRVIPYLKVHFTSCFLVLKSRNRRLQLARMGIKSCAQRDK